jgi:two-component sensor histidine kinase
MSLIHEKLYQSKGLAKIDFDDYIRDLANGLFQSYGANSNIKLFTDVRDVSLGIDSAIPCGLVVNELVTNSLKHAFPDGRRGEVLISLHPTPENMIELIVRDNGVSIPANIDIRKTESLGLHLVTILVENQLHGEINLNRSKGTEFLVKFKDVK